MPKKYIRLDWQLYEETKTAVKTSVGLTNGFRIKIGWHLGSVLIPYLFKMIMSMMTEDIRQAIPWNIIFSNDVVISETTKEKTRDRGRKVEIGT